MVSEHFSTTQEVDNKSRSIGCQTHRFMWLFSSGAECSLDAMNKNRNMELIHWWALCGVNPILSETWMMSWFSSAFYRVQTAFDRIELVAKSGMSSSRRRCFYDSTMDTSDWSRGEIEVNIILIVSGVSTGSTPLYELIYHLWWRWFVVNSVKINVSTWATCAVWDTRLLE